MSVFHVTALTLALVRNDYDVVSRDTVIQAT